MVASLLSTLTIHGASAVLGKDTTFMSKLKEPVSTAGEASKGDGLPDSSVINASRVINPLTVGSAPTLNSTTSPFTASFFNAGVEPPQQSHAGQFALNSPPKIVRFCGTPELGGEGIGALPSTRASSLLS